MNKLPHHRDMEILLSKFSKEEKEQVRQAAKQSLYRKVKKIAVVKYGYKTL